MKSNNFNTRLDGIEQRVDDGTERLPLVLRECEPGGVGVCLWDGTPFPLTEERLAWYERRGYRPVVLTSLTEEQFAERQAAARAATTPGIA